MDVAVAADADPEHVVSQSRTAIGVGNEMVEVEPDFVGTAGSRTAPSFATEDLSLLSFGGVSVAGIEADSLVLDWRESIF